MVKAKLTDKEVFMNIKQFFFLLVYLILFWMVNSCKTSIENRTIENRVSNINNTNKPQMIAHPPIIIYKTTKDYFYNVPVCLSADKTMIFSYPDISDVFYQGELVYPTKLAGGFLLDNRGIDANSVFLKYTYEEYCKLSATPSPEMLFNMIIDKDPFSEIYQLNCNRDTSEINKTITGGLQKNCKKIK